MKIFSLLFLLVVFACSESKFEENLFSNDEDSTQTFLLDTIIELNVSSDSIEVNSPIVFSIIAQGINVDSTAFSFDGKTIDKYFSNFVPAYTRKYEEVGIVTPFVTLYSHDTSYVVSTQLTIVEEGFFLKADSLIIITSDTIIDEYKKDTTLTVGSVPLIAFLGGIDTVIFIIGDSFIDPGAIAFDEEDGEIDNVILSFDSVLTTSTLLTPPTYASLIYTIIDSDSNVVTRNRVCKVVNPLYKLNYKLNEEDTVYDGYGNHPFSIDENRAMSDSIAAIGKESIYIKLLAVGSDDIDDETSTLVEMVSDEEQILSLTCKDSVLKISIEYNSYIQESFDIPNFDITERNDITIGINGNGISVIINETYYNKQLEEPFEYINNCYNPFLLSLGSDITLSNSYSGKLATFKMLVSQVADQYIEEMQ